MKHCKFSLIQRLSFFPFPGVPEIKAEVGGTSFSGLPPPMIWLTETRKTAIPPPKPTPFMVADPSTQVNTIIWIIVLSLLAFSLSQ